MKEIKVLLADDHTIVLDGLEVVLQQESHITIAGRAHNGLEVLAFLEQEPVDVVVMDINMPEMDGLTCSRKIKSLYPDIKIIILTMYPQQSFVDQIIKLGIDGCLLKNNSGAELKKAIDRVVTGKKYYDLIDSFNSETEEIQPFMLSHRERDILKALSEGLTSVEIAEKLFISEHTVRTHRKNMLKKSNMSNTSQLIQYAIKHKYI